MTTSAIEASATKSRRARGKSNPAAERPAKPPEAPLECEAAEPPQPPSPRQPTKQGQLTALLLRDEGATLDQMVEATGWLKHTVRAALTGIKKKGYGLSSDKVDGLRTYRAVAPE